MYVNITSHGNSVYSSEKKYIERRYVTQRYVTHDASGASPDGTWCIGCQMAN